MPPAGAAALAAAERMIDRVHRHAAIVRHAPKPALAAGLADRDVRGGRIRYRADRSLAAARTKPLLTCVAARATVFLVPTDDICVGACPRRELRALADLDLDVMHDGADRHVANGHGSPRLHVDVLAGDDRISLSESLRRQNVGEFAVIIFDESDKPGPVRIVFDALDACRLIV